MTKEEKNEMYRKNKEKKVKSRKSKIIALIVVPVIGVAVTFLLGTLGQNRQNEIASATVLDSMSIGEFLEKNDNGSAIYTGTIRAVDPVSIREESGEYIMLQRKVEREEKIYNKEADKYEKETRTISNDNDNCSEIEIDDVTVPYRSFRDLPTSTNTYKEGPDSNLTRTTFSYIPSSLDGTFFLKCDNGKVSSAQYYASEDIAGESKRGFGMAKVFIWLVIIVIEAVIVLNLRNTSKAIKNIEEKMEPEEDKE